MYIRKQTQSEFWTSVHYSRNNLRLKATVVQVVDQKCAHVGKLKQTVNMGHWSKKSSRYTVIFDESGHQIVHSFKP